MKRDSAGCGSGGGDPDEATADGKGNAVSSDRIGIGLGWERESQAKPAALAQQALDAAAAELEVAEPPRIMGIDLLSPTGIGEKGTLGDGIEGGDGHGQAEALDLVSAGEGAVLPVPSPGLVVAEAGLGLHAATVVGDGGVAAILVGGQIPRLLGRLRSEGLVDVQGANKLPMLVEDAHVGKVQDALALGFPAVQTPAAAVTKDHDAVGLQAQDVVPACLSAPLHQPPMSEAAISQQGDRTALWDQLHGSIEHGHIPVVADAVAAGVEGLPAQWQGSAPETQRQAHHDAGAVGTGAVDRQPKILARPAGKGCLDEGPVVRRDIDGAVAQPAIKPPQLALRLGLAVYHHQPATQMRAAAHQQGRHDPGEYPLSPDVLAGIGLAHHLQDRRMGLQVGGHRETSRGGCEELSTIHGLRDVRQPRSYVLSPSLASLLKRSVTPSGAVYYSQGATLMKTQREIPVIITMIAILVAIAAVELLVGRPSSTNVSSNAPATGSGVLSRDDAIATTVSFINDRVGPTQFITIEPRLMSVGQAKSLESVDGVPFFGSREEADMASSPVWVVVFSVDKNLAQTDLFGSGGLEKDLYLGKAGAAYVWPDGSSRGSVTIDATAGEVIGWTAHSRESTTDVFYDRVLAYPTSQAP